MSVSGKYGTTIENCNLAVEKAKVKRDGIYCFRGLYYHVNNGRVKHFAAYGDLYAAAGHFISKIGEYKHTTDAALNKKNIKALLG